MDRQGACHDAQVGAVLLDWMVMVILANPRVTKPTMFETRDPPAAYSTLRDLIPATTSQERAPIENVMKTGRRGDQPGHARAGSQSVVAARRRLGDRKCLTKQRRCTHCANHTHSTRPTVVRGYLLDRASLSRLLDTLHHSGPSMNVGPSKARLDEEGPSRSRSWWRHVSRHVSRAQRLKKLSAWCCMYQTGQAQALSPAVG